MNEQLQPSGGWIGARFLERLVAGTKGRVFLLNFLQSTEESDEGAVFDTLVERVDDPALQKLVKVHRADEERHADIFRRAVKRVGGPWASEPVADELRVVGQLDAMLGGYVDRFLQRDRNDATGVMEMYALLLVIEERAVREWPGIVRALSVVDPESAADVQRVVDDETRHVKYAYAICRRYAPDESTLERTLAHVRAVEAKAFEIHTNSLTRIVVERDLLSVGSTERVFWKGVARMAARAEKRANRANRQRTAATTRSKVSLAVVNTV